MLLNTKKLSFLKVAALDFHLSSKCNKLFWLKYYINYTASWYYLIRHWTPFTVQFVYLSDLKPIGRLHNPSKAVIQHLTIHNGQLITSHLYSNYTCLPVTVCHRKKQQKCHVRRHSALAEKSPVDNSQSILDK